MSGTTTKTPGEDPRIDTRVEALQRQAQRVRELCRAQARRPFILELAGTPKAGKTTVLGIMKDFLKDQGFRVSVMRERAADCPISMKGHFFFNAWTSATMLAQVLGQLDTEADVLLLDRGFVDALVWLELQYTRGQLTAQEKEVFEQFMLLERWRKLTDLTVLLFADPEKAMERENLGRIVRRTGSIMRPDFLATYNGVIREVSERYARQFKVVDFDSTHAASPIDSGIELLGKILPEVESWADPLILALPRTVVQAAFGEKTMLTAEECGEFLGSAEQHLVRRRRSELEQDPSFVQVVACAAFRHDGRYLLIERAPSDSKAHRFGQHTLWHRCHVEATKETSALEAAAVQLGARIRDDLHLSRLDDPQMLCGLWSTKPDEQDHLGLAFVVEITDPEIADSLSAKEFRRGKRAPVLRTEFHTCEDLSVKPLETWSSAAVNALPEV